MVELETLSSPRFFSADTSYSKIRIRLEAESGLDSYQWVVFRPGEADTVWKQTGRTVFLAELSAPFDAYQDYRIELHTTKQSNRAACGDDGWVAGYSEQILTLTTNQLFPTQLRGTFEGHNKGQRGNPFEVSLEPNVIFVTQGVVIVNWYLAGLPPICDKQIPIGVGHQAFSIGELIGWQFGCGNLKGWGELDSQKEEITIWYSYQDPETGERIEETFIGDRQ
ncbi:MAG: hypothetical protein AAF399_03985 [Bacteroidota bacterium]